MTELHEYDQGLVNRICSITADVVGVDEDVVL